MITKHASLILKIISVGLIIGACGLWAGAGVDMRPKYRDEQTLIGGAIWSQTIIPIGLMISMFMDDDPINNFVHRYFLSVGVIVLILTGITLIVGECKTLRRQTLREASLPPSAMPLPRLQSFDKIYFGIGVLTILAGLVTLADFIIL